MKNLIAIAMALGCAVGCGGGGDDKLLRELSESEAVELCEELNAITDNETVQCEFMGNTVPFTPEDLDCNAFEGENDTPATCDATTGDIKDCFSALNDDPCALDTPPECDFLDSPECSTGDARIAPIAARWPHLVQSRI